MELTDAQRNTVEVFKSNARETGCTVEIIEDEKSGLIIRETDETGEALDWYVDPEGVAYI